MGAKILFVTHDGASHEPLGLLYLSASLLRAGHETKACIQSKTLTAVRAWRPDFVAFQVISGDEKRWGGVARAVKDKYPKVRTIFGGPHFLFNTKADQPEADYIVRGDGEHAIVDVVEGRSHTDLKAIESLDGVPPPDRSLFYNADFPAIKSNSIRNEIATRGCLGYNTPVETPNGEVGVQDIKVGDKVVAYDTELGEFVHQPVVATSRRIADDLFVLSTSDGHAVRITGEHPVWTKSGWKPVDCLKEGDLIYAARTTDNSRLRVLPEAISAYRKAALDQQAKEDNKTKECPKFLLQGVPQGVEHNQQADFAMRRVRSNDYSEDCRHASGLLQGMLGYPPKRSHKGQSDRPIQQNVSMDSQAGQIYPDQRRGQGRYQAKQTRRQKSNEASRSSGKGQQVSEGGIRCCQWRAAQTSSCGRPSTTSGYVRRKQTGAFGQNENQQPDVRSSHTRQSDRDDETIASGREIAAAAKKLPQPPGNHAQGHLCRERHRPRALWDADVLDWTVCVRHTTQSRLCEPEAKESCAVQRPILARAGRDYASAVRLREPWVAGDESLGGVPVDKQPDAIAECCERFSGRWVRVREITFLGIGEVYNFTVCPVHSYVAAGLIVHNCPYKCSYCYNSNLQWLEMVGAGKKRLRYHSPEYIVEDIRRTFADYGGQLVSFQDDIFGIDMDWLERFSRLYQKVKIPFFAQLRPRLITKDRVRLLKEAGIHIASFAVESGNEKTRRMVLDRDEPNELIERGAALLHKYGIRFRMQNMVGLPVDDPLEDALETLRFNIKCKPTLSWSSALQAYKGTAIADYVVKIGLVKSLDELDSLTNATFFDECSLPIKDKDKLSRLQKYWSAVVRWPWLYGLVTRVLINLDLGKTFERWVFERTKQYINAREYWRVDGMTRHISTLNAGQPLDRLGNEPARLRQVVAADCR